MFENGTGDMDGVIDDDWLKVSWNAIKEKLTSCKTLHFGVTEVEGIRVYIKNHVGSSVSDLCVGVQPHLVKESVEMSKGLLDMYYIQSHSQQRHRGGLGILIPSFLV
jgi:hypothetical protein